MLPDDKGNFYLGSNYGLLWFDTKARAFYNLAEEHPLAKLEFSRASVLRTSDNHYYMGTVDGLYSFAPDELEFSRSSNKLKQIKMYNISIFNSKENKYHYLSKELNSLSSLVLSPFDNNIEFYFSVPEFYKNVYYSYRIKGQNDKWSEYDPDNKILLYGLQDGKYTMEIKASTDLSDDNASYYSLPLIVQQVWYKKWRVASLFLLAVIAMITGLLRYRFNQKLKRQQDLSNLRTKISSDLHDDVGTILSGLAMQSQMLTYSVKEEQKESLLEITRMSHDAMEHMRDTVWAMDNRKDKYENLIDRMRDFAEKNLSMKKMTHEFIISDIDTKQFIDPEKRQTIYLIFKEAITNIIKHCDGKHVIITFAYIKNNLHLTIHDNGAEKEGCKSDGLGLSNMKMRAEKIGGTLHTKYDVGFVVELNL
jgi:signal transduction histidine kinase